MSHRLAVVILNYRTPGLVIDALESIVDQVETARDVVVVVDNDSGDGSADIIDNTVSQRGWSDRVQVVRSPVNGGFAAGNNVGIRAVDAEYYLLLNSDTIVRPGAIGELLRVARSNSRAGVIGPRLEWPDGTPQVSAFRNRSPRTEFLRAAGTGFITRMFGGGETGIPLTDDLIAPDWVSFACALIRREVFEAIGLLDESYFMYFEDIDFCRRARAAGWEVLHTPSARVVHLRGGTSPVKSDSESRRRLPRYYYESRSRYLTRYYGRSGLWLTNWLWSVGWMITTLRAILEGRSHHLCDREGRDNWIRHRAGAEPPRMQAQAASRSGNEVGVVNRSD